MLRNLFIKKACFFVSKKLKSSSVAIPNNVTRQESRTQKFLNVEALGTDGRDEPFLKPNAYWLLVHYCGRNFKSFINWLITLLVKRLLAVLCLQTDVGIFHFKGLKHLGVIHKGRPQEGGGGSDLFSKVYIGQRGEGVKYWQNSADVLYGMAP